MLCVRVATLLISKYASQISIGLALQLVLTKVIARAMSMFFLDSI